MLSQEMKRLEYMKQVLMRRGHVDMAGRPQVLSELERGRTLSRQVEGVEGGVCPGVGHSRLEKNNLLMNGSKSLNLATKPHLYEILLKSYYDIF